MMCSTPYVTVTDYGDKVLFVNKLPGMLRELKEHPATAVRPGASNDGEVLGRGGTERNYSSSPWSSGDLAGRSSARSRGGGGGSSGYFSKASTFATPRRRTSARGDPQGGDPAFGQVAE
jgi:hypothetical protein